MAIVSYQGTHAVRCGACHEPFNYDVDIQEADTEHDLFVEMACKWCHTELVINLKPYLRSLTVMKNPSANGSGPMILDLPKELPSKPKKPHSD